MSRGYFNPGKDMVIISSMKEHTKTGNRAYCVHVFRELIHEAWKADLNYIPPLDKLHPIQQVMFEKNIRENPPKQQSFEDVKSIGAFTLFRLPVWPSPERLAAEKEKATKQFNQMFRTLKQ